MQKLQSFPNWLVQTDTWSSKIPVTHPRGQTALLPFVFLLAKHLYSYLQTKSDELLTAKKPVAGIVNKSCLPHCCLRSEKLELTRLSLLRVVSCIIYDSPLHVFGVVNVICSCI